MSLRLLTAASTALFPALRGIRFQLKNILHGNPGNMGMDTVPVWKGVRTMMLAMRE